MKKAQSTSSGSSNKDVPTTGNSSVYDWLHTENYKHGKPFTAVSLNDARNKKKSEKVVKPSHQVNENAKEEDFEFDEQYWPIKQSDVANK